MKKQNLKAIFYPDVPFETLYIPYIYKEIYFEGVYTDIFNQKENLTVIDVGANIGIVTHYMRQYCKKLYAVEPSGEHFAALKKNKEFNGWDNVEIFNYAIAGTDGEVVMHKNTQNRTCNSYALGYGADSEDEKVRGVAFDTFFTENKIDEVDFIKFDVEGAEDDILRSDGFKKIANRVKAIEVEFHFPTWPKLVEYMIGLGFQARRYNSSAVIVLFFR